MLSVCYSSISFSLSAIYKSSLFFYSSIASVNLCIATLPAIRFPGLPGLLLDLEGDVDAVGDAALTLFMVRILNITTNEER